ncbi:FmdE family protein [Lacihabitans sp. LS3-19]|uniref:acetolactate decarboxylase n=1 Tax=Lacihabitans sp. LS3-19 TaxID=2487335 RepID=UPI0020CD9980|nr:FmdE family protein [Lacihabitans sp. LS3-19]
MKLIFKILLFFVPILSFSQSVKSIGSMTEMGKENFAPHIKLDTISNKKHLFAMGPYDRMRGEITVFDGKPFYSSVNENGEGIVSANWNIVSPFFVYANVDNWQEIKVSASLSSVDEVQKLVAETASKYGFDLKKPFPFRIRGVFDEMTTHIVMPRSEEIQGFQTGKKQANFTNFNQKGELLGFYSEVHQGVFTSKNSFVHVHFLSDDETNMAHLDKISVPLTELIILLPSENQFPKSAVNDTDFSKGRLGHIQNVTLDDVQKMHGHLCDGLVEGYMALNLALENLYVGQAFDRTNTRIVSKSSPCLTDVAAYLTGGRYQFNTMYVDNNIDGMFIVQRIDNGKTVLVKRKQGIKPALIDQMGAKAVKNELSACDLDNLQSIENQYSKDLQNGKAIELFEIIEVSDFNWKSPLKKTFVKTDVLNKNMIKCGE